ncbi:hypothetical protein L3X38_031329 [Prunus dulcis]|uniref:Uncharacterized protein n=1 Tax=Prunus dulcis TaxID=3755 RepID=A0AAD4VDF9_PRUDU|nr:hypothetical protein L3X38_031329 [Prunus dulcis]
MNWIFTGGRPLGLAHSHENEVFVADAEKPEADFGLANDANDDNRKVITENLPQVESSSGDDPRSDTSSTCEAAAGLLRSISLVNVYRDVVAQSGACWDVVVLLNTYSCSCSCSSWRLSIDSSGTESKLIGGSHADASCLLPMEEVEWNEDVASSDVIKWLEWTGEKHNGTGVVAQVELTKTQVANDNGIRGQT